MTLLTMKLNIWAREKGPAAPSTALPVANTDERIQQLLADLSVEQNEVRQSQARLSQRLDNIERQQGQIAASQSHAHSANEIHEQLLADISADQKTLQDNQLQLYYCLNSIEQKQDFVIRSWTHPAHPSQQLEHAKENAVKNAAAAAADSRSQKAHPTRQDRRFPLKAGKQVAGIVELVEAILLYLPMKEVLLTAQRVNRQFKDVIKGSRSLQRNLFVHAATPKWTEHGLPCLLNPMLHKIVSQKYLLVHCAHTGGVEIFSFDLHDPYNQIDKFTIVPLQHKGSIIWLSLSDTEFPMVKEDGKLVGGEMETERAITRSTKDHESWFPMLLTQPPIDIAMRFNGEKVKRQDGVRRLGDLVNVVHPPDAIWLPKCIKSKKTWMVWKGKDDMETFGRVPTSGRRKIGYSAMIEE